MKTVKLIFAVMMTALSLNVWAGDVEKKSEFPVRFNVRGGVSAVSAGTGYYGLGVGGNLAGYVELPLSKGNDNWKINLGLKLNNKNLTDRQEYTVGVNNTSHNVYYTVNTNLLFIDIPVIFSYDFQVGSNSDFRLSFGAFYSRYAFGISKIAESGEYSPATHSVPGGVPVSHPDCNNTDLASPSYGVGPYINMPDNAGLIFGIGWYVKDFYIGADYEMTYDTGRANFMTALSATIGYRF